MTLLNSIHFQFSTHGVEWEELVQLFKAAKMDGRSGQKILRAFDNSTVVCLATHDGALVGAGRTLSDGEYHATIYDLAVLPNYQHQGIGQSILSRLLDKLPVWRVLLIADDDVRPFYEKLNFSAYPDLMARIDRAKLFE